METTAFNGTEYLLASAIHLTDDLDSSVEFDRNDEGIRAAIIYGHDNMVRRGPRSSTFRKALSNLLGAVVGVWPGPDGDIAKDHPDVEKTAASLNEFADERGFKDCDQLLEARTGRFTLRIREDAQSGDGRWDLDSSGSLFDD